MPRKNGNTTKVLDLHYFRASDYSSMERELEHKLDNFIHPFLNLNNCRFEIIVGKGHNSKNLIQGKNPLRYYTESYLNKMGLSYRDGGYFEGQEGVLVVEW
jgi:hypothetical protein